MSRIAGRKTVILLAFFSVSNAIAFPPGKRYNEKQAKKWQNRQLLRKNKWNRKTAQNRF